MKNTTRRASHSLTLSLIACLTACGGGSGDSAPATDPALLNVSVPLTTARANYINNGVTANFTLSGWVSSTAYP